MIRILKPGRSSDAKAEDAARVKQSVEAILADIQARGDAAVREYSQKFDNWNPPSFRLSQPEIDACFAALSPRDIEDIKFAQAQVRSFAEHQRAALRDIEVETMPGIVLGHRNIPIDTIGAYVPGGKYPLVASAHMAIVTARTAGVRRIIACTPPFEGRPAPAVIGRASCRERV